MSKTRQLTEAFTASPPDGPALKIDRAAGVIFGVKVLGRESRNRYERDSDGTEYSPACMASAVALYEGMKVRLNHPDRKTPDAARDARDNFGVLRNARVEGSDVRADLHYLKAHQLAESVAEDVERKLGVYGLSHNATAGRERFDRTARKLVIESLASVRSVDLVDRPATTRNLWESEMGTETTTLRALLEGRKPKLSAPRGKWLTRLLEDDSMTDAVGASVDGAPTDPDEALNAGFRAAVMAVFDSDMPLADKKKKIIELLTTQDKLLGTDEPADPTPAGSEANVTESQQTEADRNELTRLRREKVARDLCEAEQATPTPTQFKALVALDAEADRKAFLAEIKAAATEAPTKTRPARSGRVLTEAEQNQQQPPAVGLGQLVNSLRGY